MFRSLLLSNGMGFIADISIDQAFSGNDQSRARLASGQVNQNCRFQLNVFYEVSIRIKRI